MIIAVCGYNETGKTTIVRELERRLKEEGVFVEVKRFATLYPGTYIGKRKAKRNPTISASGKVGIRSIEAQRGNWNQRLGWLTFTNLVAVSFMARVLALVCRRRLVLFDRFVYDRYIHYSPRGILLGIAKCIGFRPALTLVLLPSIEEHEKRFLNCLAKRHGIELAHFSDEDRDELRLVRQRYREMAEEFSDCVVIDTSTPDAHQQAWEELVTRLPAWRSFPREKARSQGKTRINTDTQP